jgi:hypothetical protein
MTSLAIEEARCLVDYRAVAIRVLHIDDDPSLLDVSKQILLHPRSYLRLTMLAVSLKH